MEENNDGETALSRHVPLQLLHLRLDRQVNGFMGCDCHIEELHRGLKQLTGSEQCQCRAARAQRNHLACCYHFEFYQLSSQKQPGFAMLVRCPS